VPGDVVATDRARDLALLRLARVPEGAREVPLAARGPRPGETVHALGNSGARDGVLWRYGRGHVRQVYRHRLKGDAEGEEEAEYELNARVVETQVPSNPGDSGGPVVNDRGELVGITEGVRLSRQLVTFAIEVSEVRAVLGGVKDPDPASVSLVGGAWERSEDRGQAERTRLTFRPDGTFLLATVAPGNKVRTSVEGRYTLANGRLVLTAEGCAVLEATVRWMLDDMIVLSVPEGESRWVRLRK
jgi:S1-C subfamily serine protease